MNHHVLYFIAGSFCGDGFCPDEFRSGAIMAPLSLHFFCPLCGDVWAQILVVDQQHQTYQRPCLKHSDAPYAVANLTGVPTPPEDSVLWKGLPPSYLAQCLTRLIALLEVHNPDYFKQPSVLALNTTENSNGG